MRIKLLCVLFLMASSFAFAQKQTGAIEGWVRDNEGRAIPGVTITASSPSVIGGSVIVLTEENGRYRFPYLRPGIYEVKAELSGFQTGSQAGVRLFLGTTLTVDFVLEFAGHSENVEIIDAPPMIDQSTTAVAHTLSRELLQSLPKRQRIEDIIAMTPGVKDGDRELGDNLAAFGATGEHSNSLWIDGVNASNPRSGFLSVNYNYNWIDEVHVTGIGAPAEYGGFTGVLANFTTRSGGNQFHGLFETLFQNENLVSERQQGEPEIPYQNYDISAQLGGPIIVDRLWFFTGLQYTYNEIQPFGYNGTTSEKTPNYIGKLNFKMDDRNSLQGFFQRSDYRGEELGASANTLPEATSSTALTQSSWNATWISLRNSQTSLEARLAGYYDDSHPVDNNPNLPGHTDWRTGINSVNTIGGQNDDRSRLQANIVLSHYAADFLNGGHEFKFGTEFERSTDDSDSYTNGGMFYVEYYGSPALRYGNTPQIFDATSNRVSLFLQDDWSLTDNFKLSLGVRWDHNRGNTDRGLVFSTDPVAPRLGFVWTLDNKTQTVLKAHYGDYYDALLGRAYYFLSDSANTTSTTDRFINGEWVREDEFDTIYYSGVKGANFEQPRVRQFTIGMDRILPGNIPVGAHYIFRRFGNVLEDVTTSEYEPVPFVHPITGQALTVYSLIGDTINLLYTNPTGLYRQYHGLEVYANKQLTSKLLVSGSLVYSRLNGNYSGDCSYCPTTTNALDDPNGVIFFDQDADTVEYLWKIVGTYSLPLGFTVGGYFHHENRGRWSPIVQVPVTRQHVALSGAPGTFTSFPSYNMLDMRVEKEFVISNGRLRLTADLFNVFNNSYVTWVYPYYPSPRMGQPLIYSSPRKMRLGVRYTF